MVVLGRPMVNLAGVLLVLSPLEAVCGGFLGKIQHGVSHGVHDVSKSIAEPLKHTSAEKIAEAMSDASKREQVASTIKDTLNNTVQGAVSSAKQTVVPSVQDLSARAPNVSEVLEATAPGRQQLADALQAVGDSLQQGAGVVSSSNSTEVEGALKKAVSEAPAAEAKSPSSPAAPLPGLAEAFNKTGLNKIAEALKGKKSGDDVASALQGAAPEVAQALNKTGLQIAKAIAGESPKVATSLNKTSLGVAQMIRGKNTEAPPLHSETDGPDGAGPVTEVGSGPGNLALYMALAAVVPALCGLVVYSKYRGQAPRAGMLLSDAANAGIAMAAQGPLRAEPAAREPLFNKF